jgi:hypothetical protein
MSLVTEWWEEGTPVFWVSTRVEGQAGPNNYG